MPHPAGLPDLFVDRSLGRVQVPRLLRAAGLRLVTLAERYGVPADEQVSDEQWLTDVGNRGEVAFMKDGRVRYNAAEKAAITRHSVRCFCLARRDLTAEAMASRFLHNWIASKSHVPTLARSFTRCTRTASSGSTCSSQS